MAKRKATIVSVSLTAAEAAALTKEAAAVGVTVTMLVRLWIRSAIMEDPITATTTTTEEG